MSKTGNIDINDIRDAEDYLREIKCRFLHQREWEYVPMPVKNLSGLYWRKTLEDGKVVLTTCPDEAIAIQSNFVG